MDRMTTAQRDRSLPDPDLEPTITIPHAGRILGMSRNAAYAAAKDGRIPTIAISRSRRMVLTGEFLTRYRLRRHPVPAAPALPSASSAPARSGRPA